MNDISKYVYRESDDNNVFYADFEDYETGIVHSGDYESGDMVKFIFEDVKYIGTLRECGSTTDGLFEVVNVRVCS
jgi:hypothetical protein